MYREKTAKEIEWDILIHKEAVQHATRALFPADYP